VARALPRKSPILFWKEQTARAIENDPTPFEEHKPVNQIGFVL
jgi:hypothetical protein